MRHVVNCKQEPYDIFIARPSKFGNIYTHHRYGTLAKYIVDSRKEAIIQYENWLQEQPSLMIDICRELQGKVLGCFCNVELGLDCHGYLLARIANNAQLCMPIPIEVFYG
jgi:hypothetical protein